MELPSISAWSAGTEHDEDKFNELAYALSFLLDPPECHVTATSAQSIPTGTATATAVTFHSVTKDNDDMWDAGTPTYVTVQTPGWYEAEWSVSWFTRADTTIRAQALYLNGSMGITTATAYNDYVNDSGTTPQVWMSYDLFLNSGDKVYLGVLHASATALSTASSGSDATLQTFLRLRWASL